MDSDLNFNSHIKSVTSAAFYHLKNIAKIKNLVSKPNLEILIHAFVSSRLDYCNGLLTGLSKRAVKQLQYIQNAAARVLTRTRKYDHISPVLRSLHWLPVPQRIDFKAALLFEYLSLLPPLPGEDSALKWGGKKFEELPIVHIKATYNNTHIQLTDSEGQSLVRTSCGTEGFKNIKKSTPIAAQTAGISAAAKATGKGVTFVRVVVKGIGPGRQSAIKGLAMGGLEVVSITDNTPVPHNGCRPRKARRM
uniref:Small ribosomal subunit protein uS11m n=1 Tax=Oryzias latipes TaxID=8090 RepID=H2MI00_ORYLA